MKLFTNENIKRLRKEKGLTQKELGERIGVSQSAIGQFEKKGANLKLSTLEKIASELGVTMGELAGIEQDKQYTNTHPGNSPMTEKEEKLLADFRKLNTEGQQYILQTMDMVKDKYKKSDSIPELEDIG